MDFTLFWYEFAYGLFLGGFLFICGLSLVITVIAMLAVVLYERECQKEKD
jgi:hypothetical protein